MLKLFIAVVISGLLLLFTNLITSRTFILEEQKRKETISRECSCHKVLTPKDYNFTKSFRYYKNKPVNL